MNIQTLEEARAALRRKIDRMAEFGEFVSRETWGLVTCRCRDADAMILAIEFDLRLAVAGANDDFPCGAMVLQRIPPEYATPAPQGKHD